ncbi:L,D-transpeptidase [Phaeacidiphilus oryzae]|uniref:L,D-transpeptidase n=1 Tax=Phaeacidiphilus oryzae TaxID=348818 RepID=UPI00068B37AF|nr:Ig-like domain-containing protein [Phaeacidiphilus oryzae]
MAESGGAAAPGGEKERRDGGARGRRVVRRTTGMAAVAALALVGASACSSGGSGGSASQQMKVSDAKISVAFSKASDGGVATDKPVKLNVTGGTLASVTVADSQGDPVAGTLKSGTWTPTSPLGTGAKYVLRASATSGSGTKPKVDRISFTTESPGSDSQMLLDSISPAKDSVVGVAQPVSIIFSTPVAESARAAIEKQIKITTSNGTTGAFHWFGDSRVDWRPQNYWQTGTKVTVAADFNGVSDGNGRLGIHDYVHHFTVGSDVRVVDDINSHQMKVYNGGKLVRTMASDAGRPGMSTWTGTMAIIDKQPTVHMTSCSVGIACSKSDPNYYDLSLPWDLHLTYSGTYIHYSTGDTDPGSDNSSHGCIHLALADAKWLYGYVKPGDPVTVNGSGDKAAADNGFADWNMSWSQWKTGSSAAYNA